MILYFSGTGNSKYVASRIAEATSEKIFSIEDCIRVNNYKFDLDENENLGIICPTYFFGVPVIVKDFFKRAKINCNGNNYVYGVTTCGGFSGGTLDMLEELLKNINIELKAKFDIVMVDTWTPSYDVSDLKSNEEVQKKSEVRIDFIIKKIMGKKAGTFQSKKLPGFIVKRVYFSYDKACSTKYFTVNNDCTGCGMCEVKCPCGAIEVKNGKPVWKSEKCILCLRCLHNCPKAAIEYKKKTKKHGQYINPNVKV